MRLRNWLLVVSFVAALLTSCKKVEEPEFRRLEGFKVKKLGLQAADIGFGVAYFNPNNFGLNVKEAVVDVYVDSIFMGKFRQPNLVEVDKKAEFAIPFEGSIPVAKVLQLKLGDVVNRDVTVRAEGSVKVGKAGVFVSRNIKYQGKHQLDLRL